MAHNQSDTWLIFQNGKLIVIREAASLRIPCHDHIHIFTSSLTRQFSIGEYNAINIYCGELDHNHSLDDHTFQAISLRQALEELGDEWYQVATKAYSVINWDKNHTFCGRCGQQTEKSGTQYERHCANCDLHFYPRISPSVIVLIQRGDHILMARGHHFKPGVYGLIAGFVEPGETIEETIHREIYEEVGITVTNLRYIRSQAWPFPDSLMLGFFADYKDGDIQIDDVEIAHADWYRYDNLPGRPSTSISIASKLIEQYIREQN